MDGQFPLAPSASSCSVSKIPFLHPDVMTNKGNRCDVLLHQKMEEHKHHRTALLLPPKSIKRFFHRQRHHYPSVSWHHVSVSHFLVNHCYLQHHIYLHVETNLKYFVLQHHYYTIMMKRRCYGSCLLLVASASAFGPLSPTTTISHNNKHASRIRKNVVLHSSSDEDLLSGSSSVPLGKNTGRINSAFSLNEFSRILHIDRVFQHRRPGNNQEQRDHVVNVKADADECKSLAKRFDLKGLTRLEAELSFRPASEALVGGSGSGGGLPVEVEGAIEAHLTQTCVRTNEEFEIDVEFPIYAVVKPVTSNNDEDLRMLLMQQQEEEEAAAASGGKSKKKKKNKKRKKDDVFHENKKVHNLSDIFDLQAAIQEADFFGDDEGGAADLVEDEAIYSLSSEQLDVGELIAQTFWLQLDPYPKKPGSDPVSWEISG